MPNLLSPDAVWIGPAHPFDLHEAYLNFRRRFTLDSTARVELTITADSRYVVVTTQPTQALPGAMR